MGTFHQNKGELHGVTVVVETKGPKVYIGRCHEQGPDQIVLMDVDEHTDGEDGLSKADYIRRAARWGVFTRHRSLRVPLEQVQSLTPLGQIALD